MPEHVIYPWSRRSKREGVRNSGHSDKNCPNTGKPFKSCYCGDCRKYRAKHGGSNDRD
jgi:hypothetical protein